MDIGRVYFVFVPVVMGACMFSSPSSAYSAATDRWNCVVSEQQSKARTNFVAYLIGGGFECLGDVVADE
eukprot:14018118-Heterocapsa_arctica.AAC.1